MNTLFLDLETSAISPEEGQILQVFAAMLSDNGDELEEPLSAILPLPKTIDPAAKKIHEESGLLTMCADSDLNLIEVDRELASYISSFGCERNAVERFRQCSVAGFSPQFDLAWIRWHMPISSSYIHYRVLDLSSVRTVFQAAGVELVSSGAVAHLADADTQAAFGVYRKAVKLIKSMREGHE